MTEPEKKSCKFFFSCVVYSIISKLQQPIIAAIKNSAGIMGDLLRMCYMDTN